MTNIEQKIEYKCKKCGAELKDDKIPLDSLDYGGLDLNITYCPNCGYIEEEFVD